MFEGVTKKQKTTLLGSLITMVLLGVLAIVVLIAYLNKAYSWFSSNKNVSGNGMGVSVEGIDAQAEYMVYLFDAKQNGVRYTDDGWENDPKVTDLKMQIHDIIFKSRNRYTPALVHIHLYDIKDEYRDADGTVSITLTRDGSPAFVTGAGGTQQLPTRTSSVLRFTLTNNKGETWLSSNDNPKDAAQELYDNADSALYSKIVTNKNYTDTADLDIDSKVFTTVSGGTITKVSAVVLSVGYTASQVAEGELDLFLYLTYDEDLVGAFERAVEIGQGGTSVGEVTTFTNDLSSLVVSFKND